MIRRESSLVVGMENRFLVEAVSGATQASPRTHELLTYLSPVQEVGLASSLLCRINCQVKNAIIILTLATRKMESDLFINQVYQKLIALPLRHLKYELLTANLFP